MINPLRISDDPVAVLRDASVDTRIVGISALEAPRDNTDDDVLVLSEGTTGVSLASVLAADVQDTGAQHVFGDVRPVLVTRLGLQVSVTRSTQILVDGVDVNVLQLFRV